MDVQYQYRLCWGLAVWFGKGYNHQFWWSVEPISAVLIFYFQSYYWRIQPSRIHNIAPILADRVNSNEGRSERRIKVVSASSGQYCCFAVWIPSYASWKSKKIVPQPGLKLSRTDLEVKLLRPIFSRAVLNLLIATWQQQGTDSRVCQRIVLWWILGGTSLKIGCTRCAFKGEDKSRANAEHKLGLEEELQGVWKTIKL